MTSYMAPELLEGEQVDEQADLYSLGVTIYEMCQGYPPFGGTLPRFKLRAAKPHSRLLTGTIFPRHWWTSSSAFSHQARASPSQRR